jgi:large subunit ribosomal protein L25
MTEADVVRTSLPQWSVIDAVAPDARNLTGWTALATPVTGVVPRPASRPTAPRSHTRTPVHSAHGGARIGKIGETPMSENKLVATARTSFGKGAARSIRREGNIPAVMYGHGTEPVHISLPGHQTMMALKVANVLLTIEIDGKDQLALAKDIQRDPVRPIIEHVDLVVVRKGEKVNVDVPVHLVGVAAVETVVTVENNTVELAVEATHIPDQVDVSVEGLDSGTQIHASDLVLPKGAELVTDAATLIVNITKAISAEALEAELAAELASLVGEVPAAEAPAAEAADGEVPTAEGEQA